MNYGEKMRTVPSYEDLLLKAALLAEGVDFSTAGLLQRLADERKVRAGTGLYNYHRTPEQQKADTGSQLEVFGQSNIVAPNEIHFSEYEYPFIVEVRSNPNSSYKILSEGMSYALVKNSSKLHDVDFPIQYNFNFEPSPYGTLYGNIVHPMGRNGLRIYPDMTCLMDRPGIKCQFCGTLPKRRIDRTTGLPISAERLNEEIVVGINKAQAEMPVDHIFMSAGAFYDATTTQFYAELITGMRKALRNRNAEILFAMTPPPAGLIEQIDVLIEAGISDLSFNLEAWDDALWQKDNNERHLGLFKIGRGKKDHFAGFNRVLAALGRGSAKSNFVGGIEELPTLFQGFDVLLELGVIPSITVYYHTPGAEWVQKNFDPRVDSYREDSAAYLVEAYMGLAKRTRAHGFKPHWARENRISGLEWDTYCHISSNGSIPSRVQERNQKRVS